MTLGEFLSGRLGALAGQGICAAVSILFLAVTGTSPGVLILLALTWLLVFLAAQAAAYLKCRAHLAELESIMDGLDQKHLFAECAPKPRSIYERRLQELMRRSGRAMIGAVSDAHAAQREYREYVESWVHEIKAPITAAQLICRSIDGETRRKLSCELAQIESHVERALFYARAESPEKDFIIRPTPLADIAAQAIEQHRALLIQSGVRIETEGLERTTYTDGKWAAFMLGQLLQNAVRYRGENPVISLSARELGRQVELTVADNGIGIPSHELPRVFARGFTGRNGRARGGSTGMGLYLCHRLAGFLEIDLRIKSAEGRGTCVLLTFPAKMEGSLSKM